MRPAVPRISLAISILLLGAATATGAPSPMLKTGQTACYDNAGAPIGCAGSGQDGESQTGVSRSFTDHGDGTILDNVTGLLWEKLSDDGSIHDYDNVYTWIEAFQTKIATLNAEQFAGYSDWRLPNIREFETLANLGATAPATYGIFTAGCAPGCSVFTCSCTRPDNHSEWSSTSIVGAPGSVWTLHTESGATLGTEAWRSWGVRAVRGVSNVLRTGQTLCYDEAGTPIDCAGTGQDGESQSGIPRSFVDNGDGTVTDHATGLVWEKLSDDGSIHDQDDTYTWTSAVTGKIATLNAMNFGGHDDWRLPNTRELLSLSDFGASGPAAFEAFDSACAPGCSNLDCSCTPWVGSWYPAWYWLWASTTENADRTRAWGIAPRHGGQQPGVGVEKWRDWGVRAVRGGVVPCANGDLDNGTICDDGIYCNGVDLCTGGSCSVHIAPPCAGPDGDADCAESCDEATHACNVLDPDGSPCNDGLFCTATDTCLAGTCVARAARICNDRNVCTDDSCREDLDVCEYVNNSAPCDDGVACNGADTCAAGDCTHDGPPCPVTCTLGFVLQAGTAPAALQYKVDYSGAAGAILGSANRASCSNAMSATLAVFGDDDGARTLHWSFVRLADSAGPFPIGSCTFEADAIPAADEFVVTVEDAAGLATDGIASNVCGAPATGELPPYSRDALVVLEEAVGLAVRCALCECDTNGDLNVQASDSLRVLRESAYTGAGLSCSEPCTGIVTTAPPVPAGSIAVELDCHAMRCGDGVIDPEEQCDDGNTAGGDCCSPQCLFEPAGTLCRAQADVCDVAELCTGTSASCPDDEYADAGVACRPAAGVCDVPEACGGEAAGCPPDALASPNAICRAALGACDVPEACTSGGPACPADAYRPDLAPCDDDLFCNGADACQAGNCNVHGGDPCPQPSPNTGCVGACDEQANACTLPYPTGSPCTDGDGCTAQDTCANGVCRGEAVACDDGDACTVDSCVSPSGQCVSAIRPAAGCYQAAKAALGLMTTGDGKAQWKWGKGEAVACDAAGTPTTDTGFDLCVYDALGNDTYALVSHFRLPPNGLWEPGKACMWSYVDRDLATDGIRQLRVAPGDDEHTSVRFRASGPLAPIPAPVAPDRFLHMNPSVHVQLFNDGGACWGAEYREAKVNSGEKFKTNRLILVGP